MAHKFMVKVVPPKVTVTSKPYHKPSADLELSGFSDDLMESILEQLSSADRIRFGATCKKNLSFVTTQQHHRRHQYQFRTIDKLPWMATFTCSGIHDPHRIFLFRLFEPLQQERGRPHYAGYEIHDPKREGLGKPNHTRIKACKKGWFLCLWPKEEREGKTCFLLFCPFNNRIIKLPDLDHDLDKRYDQLSCKATFSSDDPSSPDCVFFFLSQKSTPEKYSISTLDQNSRKWNTKLFNKLIFHVSSVVYHEGCFYCLSIQGELAAYDVAQQTWSRMTARSPLSNINYGISQINLVVCQGKLVIVFVDLANYEHNNLEVFRCSIFEFSSSTSTWVEKTSLGDHAIFFGDPTSFSVPLPSGSDVADRMYFYSYKMDKASPIYYSLKDGRCLMSENGDYWSSVEGGMWIEPLPPF